MKRHPILTAFVVSMALTSCFGGFGDQELGDGYFISYDGRFKVLVKDTQRKGDGSGTPLLRTENVLRFTYDSDYIIAVTAAKEPGRRNFWFVDKNLGHQPDELEKEEATRALSSVLGPMDSMAVAEHCMNRGIALQVP